MRVFDPRSEENRQKNMGEVAAEVAKLVNDGNTSSVQIFWGDDQILVRPGVTADEVLTVLEMSADDQEKIWLRD